MIIEKEINGQVFSFEVGRHFETAERIKGMYDGYMLIHQSDGFKSFIFLKSTNYFASDKKARNLGYLDYDFEQDVVTYRKFGFDKSKHEHHIDQCFGLCWDIISNLCPKDKVIIQEKADKKDNFYIISVNKILKFQNFKHYKAKGFEKQVFIPVTEFKQLTVKNKRTK